MVELVTTNEESLRDKKQAAAVKFIITGSNEARERLDELTKPGLKKARLSLVTHTAVSDPNAR